MTIENRAKGDKPIQAIADEKLLYKQAMETFLPYELEMRTFLDDLRAANPGEFGTVEFKLGPLKSMDRISPKVDGEYGGNASKIADIVRGTFVSDHVDDLPRIQAALEERFSVVQVKDRVFDPTKTGLRNYHNNIQMPNGHIVETQVMPSQLWMVKSKSHDLMEEVQVLEREYPNAKGRPPEIQTQMDALNRENRALQNAAIYETGLNSYLNPDFTPKERAQFTVPFEMTKEFNASVKPMEHMGYTFNKEASPFMKGAQKYMPSSVGLGLAGGTAIYALSKGASPAQAAEVFYEGAVPYGEAQVNFAQGDMYGAVRSATVETVSNMAFGACAVPGAAFGGAGGTAVMPGVGTAVGAGGGALVAGTGCAVGAGVVTDKAFDVADRLPQATVDVAGFAGEKIVSGGAAFAHGAMEAVDDAFDTVSGDAAVRQAIYDALPVLETAANDDGLALTDVDADPIHAYPAAYAMAQIKTDIVFTEDMMEQIDQGAKSPLGRMDKAESVDFLQRRVDRLHERFEVSYDQAKADGTLGEIVDYTAQYGARDMQPSLAIQDVSPAANQSWDTPKVRAFAM